MAGREHCLLFALLVGIVASDISDIDHDLAGLYEPEINLSVMHFTD